jgi:TRAP-type C4-dicarboxylate transport system permease small subunit
MTPENTSSIFRKLERILEPVLKAAHFASALPLIALVIITTVDIVARYLFNASLYDTFEITRMLLSAIISLALARSCYDGDQISVTLVTEKVSPRLRNFFNTIVSLVGFLAFIVITAYAILKGIESYQRHEYQGWMELPTHPSKFIFAFGCFLTLLAFIVVFLRSLRRLYKADE